MSEREAYFDKEIAPILRTAVEMCRAQGMSIVCLVEYEEGPEGRCTIQAAEEDASLDFKLAHYMAMPGASIDGLALATGRYLTEHKLEHSSIVLTSFGIEPKPEDR